MTFFLSTDLTDINLYPKSHAHKPRRGRFRQANDGNLSPQQHGHFNQGFRPPFGHDGSNYAGHQHPHYQDENLSGRRGRGRGRRDGNRGVNGTSSFQTPGEEHGKVRGEGPEAANWRRDPDRNVDQTNEEQEGQIKKPRKYSQEQRGRRPNERGPRPKADNTTDEGQRSNHTKAEGPVDTRDRTYRKREEGADVQYERKRPEVKHRQGPIKPARPLPQEERGPDLDPDGGQEFSHVFHDAFRGGRGPGRYTSSQPRGGRRMHPPSQRPGLRNWDKVPESKETQTGQTQTAVSLIHFLFLLCEIRLLKVLAQINRKGTGLLEQASCDGGQLQKVREKERNSYKKPE